MKDVSNMLVQELVGMALKSDMENLKANREFMAEEGSERLLEALEVVHAYYEGESAALEPLSL